jgi:hypothetical protein
VALGFVLVVLSVFRCRSSIPTAETQVLLGHADCIQRRDDLADARAGVERVEESAESRPSLNEQVGAIYSAMAFDVDVATATPLEAVASEYREQGDVTVHRPRPLETVVAVGERLEDTLDHLVRATLVQNSPEVTLAAEVTDGAVERRVVSPGGRITDAERSLPEGDVNVTQLNHSRDIDLWATQWITDLYGGAFHIAEDAPGGPVEVRFSRVTSDR